MSDKTIYDTFAERCRRCGSVEKTWHHNPVIGGSALDHTFEPARSPMEALLAIGGGRPFLRTELTDFEFYALRSWAIKGLDADAATHDPDACGFKKPCDLCVFIERQKERVA